MISKNLLDGAASIRSLKVGDQGKVRSSAVLGRIAMLNYHIQSSYLRHSLTTLWHCRDQQGRQRYAPRSYVLQFRPQPLFFYQSSPSYLDFWSPSLFDGRNRAVGCIAGWLSSCFFFPFEVLWLCDHCGSGVWTASSKEREEEYEVVVSTTLSEERDKEYEVIVGESF